MPETTPKLIHMTTYTGDQLVAFRLRDLGDALGTTIPPRMMAYLQLLEGRNGPVPSEYPDYVIVDRAAFIELCLRLTIGRP